MKIIKLSVLLFILLLGVAAVASPVFLHDNAPQLSMVSAFGGGGGEGGGGGGEGGGDGCGGCGGGEGGGDGGGGGAEVTRGCTDPNATNYNPYAEVDNGICSYPTPAPVCVLNLSVSSVPSNGGPVTISWTSNNVASDSTLWVGNTRYESIGVNSGSKSVTITEDTLIRFDIWNSSGSDTCRKTVTVEPPVVYPTCDSFNISQSKVAPNANLTFNWSTTNVTNASINNGIGAVAVDGTNQTFIAPAAEGTYTYRLTFNGKTSASCVDTVTVEKPPVVVHPTCDSFSIAQSTVLPGANLTFNWSTTNVSNVSFNNGIGSVSVDGSNQTFTAPTTDGTYTYTLTFDGKTSASCVDTVVVKTPVVHVPQCDAFGAEPSVITVGESSLLTWETTNATRVTINTLGEVAADGSASVSPLTTTTYLLTAFGANDAKDQCEAKVTVKPKVETECKLTIDKTVDKHTAEVGDDVTYTIKVKNTGTADCTGGGVKIYDVVDPNLTYKNYTLTSNLTAGYGGQPVYTSSDRTLRFNGNVLTPNESGTITWTGTVKNPTQCGDFVVNNQAKVTAKELNNFGTWVYSQIVTTDIDNDCVVLHPRCDAFTIAESTVVPGADLTFNWSTTNVSNVSFNNDIGAVAVDGVNQTFAAPVAEGTYTYTLTFDGQTNNSCVDTVKVEKEVTPGTPAITIVKRDAADADDTQTVATGGTAAFEIIVTNTGNEDLVNVEVTDPREPACNETIGDLAVDASYTYTCNSTNVQSAFINVADTTGDSAVDGQTVTDSDPTTVEVEDTPTLTCSDISISASDTSVTEGSDVTLEWVSTGNVSSVSIDNGIGSVALTGSRSVRVNDTTTYNFTIDGFNDSVSCPITISATTGGGGGGGSSSPRCELEISDSKINRGDEITLTWDSTRARELILTDDRGNVLVTTEDRLSDDKEELFEGEITLTPTRDTEYTLRVERGSRDRECNVDVEMDDEIVLLQTRDQAPLVAGISLTEVPYTGFEAGTVMTFMFYALLVAWALYITYVLVIPKSMLSAAPVLVTPRTTSDLMTSAESIRPDVFAALPTKSVVASSAPTAAAPANLPVAQTAPVAATAATEATEADTATIATEVENEAHLHQALLSSGAVQSLIAMTTDADRSQTLTKVISDAKGAYPLEDGWVVINQTRLTELTATPAAPATTEVTGNGSLAEAVVTGNVVAAYEMIGARPMFALADASADLDALYRNRKGANEQVSDLLTTATKDMTDAQIADMIAALTGAIDGTYTDEASAVKMAIMKAIKIAA